MLTIDNFIGGEAAAPIGGTYLEDFEPATGKVHARVADSDARDVARAVEAAQAAFPSWAHTSAAERSRMLLAVADGIEQRLEEFARAETMDSGKPISVSRSLDIPRAISNLRFFATAILHTHTEAHAMDDVALNYTTRQPRGVAGLISPWNLPLYLFTWKIAPALATGNTVVAKPSELTPLTASLLGPIVRAAGIPAGVFNVVHGLGAKVGEAITSHPRVPTISFTGGTATGARVAIAAAPHFKKVSLELGGKNPNLVFADADLDEAIRTSLRSSFANQGQICLCGSRILVEESVHDEFVARLSAAARKLRIGDPLASDTEQGSLISHDHREKVRSYVELARAEGGRIECGGKAPADVGERCRDGYFFEPTVITGLGPSCRINQEEIFGPVVSVIPFRDDAEAIAIANGTPYGLAATVWTRSLTRAQRVSAALDAGVIWVNCWLLRDLRVPFGGMKQSGVGREGGDEALRFFTEAKNICIKS
ncbi:MAG: aldehyde dehydrogenase [Planctomycetota bacterium]